jgi:hypothetical protein
MDIGQAGVNGFMLFSLDCIIMMKKKLPDRVSIT